MLYYVGNICFIYALYTPNMVQSSESIHLKCTSPIPITMTKYMHQPRTARNKISGNGRRNSLAFLDLWSERLSMTIIKLEGRLWTPSFPWRVFGSCNRWLKREWLSWLKGFGPFGMGMGRCSRSTIYFPLSQMVTLWILLFCFFPFKNRKFLCETIGFLANESRKDVVMEYCYGHSQHLLENDDLNSKSHNAYFQIGKAAALFRHMYWIFQLMQSLPNWLTVLLSSSLGLILELRQVWASHIVFNI